MKKIYERLMEKKNDKFDFKKNNQMSECKKIEHPFDGGRPSNLGQADIKDGEKFDVMAQQKSASENQQSEETSHVQKSKKDEAAATADVADGEDDDGKGDVDEPRRRPYVIVDNFMEYEEYLQWKKKNGLAHTAKMLDKYTKKIEEYTKEGDKL